MDVISNFAARYERTREEEYSLEEYLEICKRDTMAYATAAERMLQAIGEPQMIDTRNDPRLSRIFTNKIIKIYPAFEEFYGMEDAIEQVVSYFRHAAQGLEEKKQILYLLGPVGGGKSSLAERLKDLMEVCPIYVLKAGEEVSPIFESPLGLFDPATMGEALEQKYRIPARKLTGRMSPWAVKRLDEFGAEPGHAPVESAAIDLVQEFDGHVHGGTVVGCSGFESIGDVEFGAVRVPRGGEVVQRIGSRATREVVDTHVEQVRLRGPDIAPPAVEVAR